MNIDNVSFVALDQKTAEAAADLAIRSGLRGMDALVIQTAKEYDGELLTFDDEMMKRAELVLTKP
jgi:predicted nucleic acid-binding protein